MEKDKKMYAKNKKNMQGIGTKEIIDWIDNVLLTNERRERERQEEMMFLHKLFR